MTVERIRLDKWLWVARFAHSRGAAQAMCRSGLIRVCGRRVEKSGREIHPGDIITIPQLRKIQVVRVVCSAQGRGPTTKAKQLYEIIEENLP